MMPSQLHYCLLPPKSAKIEVDARVNGRIGLKLYENKLLKDAVRCYRRRNAKRRLERPFCKGFVYFDGMLPKEHFSDINVSCHHLFLQVLKREEEQAPFLFLFFCLLPLLSYFSSSMHLGYINARHVWIWRFLCHSNRCKESKQKKKRQGHM